MKENWKKYLAECVGTACLTLFACGIAVFTTQGIPGVLTIVDTVAISLAFGGVLAICAFALGPVSGCHINPAVSLAFLIRKEISFKDFCFYVLSQFVGGFVGSLILLSIVANMPLNHGLGANAINVEVLGIIDGNLGERVLNAWSYIAAFLVEVVLTMAFVLVILVATDKKRGSKFAPLIIGGALMLAHLMGVGLTGTSVNPARSLAPSVLMAFFGKTESISQVWIWLLAPMAGGALAALLYNVFNKNSASKVEEKPAEEPKAE